MSQEWVENRPPRGFARGFDVAEAWRHRELAWFLAVRQLKLRYKQTALGVAWVLLQPLAGMALLSLIFSRVNVGAGGEVPYAVFVLTGFVAWTYVSTSVGIAAESLVEDRALVTKIYFPRVLAPASALLPSLVDLVISLALVAVVMAIADVGPGSELALMPAAVVLLMVIAGGAGLWLSALNVAYRDVRYVLGFLTQAWFLVSPVFYASSIVPDGWKQAVFHLNPMVGAIDLFRWALDTGPAPGSEIAISIASALVVLVGGALYFARVQAQFADIA